MQMEAITKEYDGKIIRCLKDAVTCYYSIVDVIKALTKSKDANHYWRCIKSKITKNSENDNNKKILANIKRVKMTAPDGKRHLTDIIDEKNLSALMVVIPSKKKEKFAKWLRNEDGEIVKENEEIITCNSSEITNLIYEIRGLQVMFDSDLAKLYRCKNGTKEINQAVKNNYQKFPSNFTFRLNDQEWTNFLVKNFDQKIEMRGRGWKNPRVFTEQGVVMLATILKSKVATNMTVSIINAFVLMRQYLSHELLEQRYLMDQTIKNTEDIKILQETLKKFVEKKKDNEIYFNGQIYDAYSKVVDIFKTAKKELVIIDGYADKVVLDMIREIKVPVTLIVKKHRCLKELDIQKYKTQYHNLRIIYDDTFHDRYFIIDKEVIYHSGTSLNHIGKRTFSLNLLSDELVKNSLLKKIAL